MATGGFAARGPARAGWDWHAIRVAFHVTWLVLLTAVLLVGSGAVLGGAVGYGLSWLVETALGSIDFST